MKNVSKLLLHVCCSPCAAYPHAVVTKKFDVVIGYFYNPNIHPYSEYLKREESLKKFSKATDFKVIYEKNYDMEEFIRNVVFREENRCYYCISNRLEKTARLALSSKFSHFSTTLLYSKHQKNDYIKDVGFGLETKYGVKFYYEDFRLGYKDGIKLSYDHNLYRQNYCGCIYSEKERFYKKNLNK